MLSKEQFMTYVETMKKINDKRSQLEEMLNAQLDTIYNDFYTLMDMVIESNFDEQGRDTFFAYIYEGRSRFENNVCLMNLDDLWDYLTKHFNYESTEEVSRRY